MRQKYSCVKRNGLSISYLRYAAIRAAAGNTLQQWSWKMTTVSKTFVAGLDEVANSWGVFLALGTLLIISGFVCLGVAHTATYISIETFGWILVFSGLIWFVNTFMARSWGGLFIYLLNAIIRCVAGYALLTHPDGGAAGFTIALASLLIVGGAFRAATAGVIQFPRWGWAVLAGAVSMVLGIVLLSNWPAASNFLIGVVIAVDLILEGSALVGFALTIHSLYKAQSYTSA
jgi:uncharacterized membrane protein HdeD (DUF308 family)